MRILEIGLGRITAAAALICAGIALSQASMADGLRVIELTDGTMISGEIISFESGVYTIESDVLGRLHLPDANIRAIRSSRHDSSRDYYAEPNLVSPGSAAAQNLGRLETQFLNDPNTLFMVMALQNDPEVLAILNDPEVMQAIAARDLDSLQSNPKILQLEHNPTIQQILRLMGRQ